MVAVETTANNDLLHERGEKKQKRSTSNSRSMVGKRSRKAITEVNHNYKLSFLLHHVVDLSAFKKLIIISLLALWNGWKKTMTHITGTGR